MLIFRGLLTHILMELANIIHLDVRDLLNATVKLRDGKKATDMDMGFMEKMAVKKALGKIEGTDIEKLLKEYGVI